MNEILRDNIRLYRKERGMTQVELGELLGVGGDTISSWERGINCPSTDDVSNMGKVFNVRLEDLLGKRYKEITLIERGVVPEDAIWPKRRGDSVHIAYEILEAKRGVLHRFTNEVGEEISAIYSSNEEIRSVRREKEKWLLEDWIKNESEY